MKDLIIQALDTVSQKVEKQKTFLKYDTISVDIDDVKPSELGEFIKQNNIPDNAYFDNDDSYRALLSYDITVPMSVDEVVMEKRRRFNSNAHKEVYNALKHGYKRVGFYSSVLREYKDTTVYDMYISKDYDRIVKYYSLYFEPLI